MNKKAIIIFLFVIPGLIRVAITGEVAEYIKIEPRNNFVLIMDKSGSMSGDAMQQAKKAIISFLADIRGNDRVGMITFNERPENLFDLTNNLKNKKNLISDIEASGSTALYDALALGFDQLSYSSGVKIIIYLTDGRDNQSNFSIEEINSMARSENILVYGIGLGEVDVAKLTELSRVTSGYFTTTSDPHDLNNVYSKVLNKYYEEYGDYTIYSGALTVKSIPGGLPIAIDGEKIGCTPYSISALEPGSYHVEIEYNEGNWQCDAVIKAGFRAVIQARSSEIDHNLIVGSRPVKSAVFLDGTYIGQTSIRPIIKEKKFFGGINIKNLNSQLKIEQVPRGRHTLKLIAMPKADVDLGSALSYEFDFKINKNTWVNVDILKKEADFMGQGDKKQDLQERVDKSFEDLKDF
ncbi:MAG: VWA domain-containing protein [Candidatus Marinimicrobia bacterium]|nr:VWA domain-containing protein [Candidatus Neomarinimicrobiota bacterium]